MSERQLHVCLVAPMPPPYGGIANWTVMLREFVEGRHDVVLDVLDIAPRWRSLHDTALWKRSVGGSLQLLRDCVRLMLCLQRKPDVVHLTTPGGLAVVRDDVMSMLAVLKGVPVVYHLRYGRLREIAEGRSWIRRRLAASVRRSACVVPVDRDTETCLLEWAPKVTVKRIGNCIDLRRLPRAAGVDGERPAVLYLGHVIPTKGIEELLEAWKRLRPGGWRLLIVGPYDAEYYRQLSAQHFSQTVVFVGEQPHERALQLLAESSIYVHPSYSEGFPNAVLEAMALGKPIIGTRVGAIPEMLGGECGLLVSPKDAHQLEAALARLMRDEGLRKRLGERAQACAIREFGMDSVFPRYKEVWAQAAGFADEDYRLRKGDAH